ncbi:MAG: hypothetical protein GY772_31640, partial [bacterium]|nr:hypothetical protein [bacterium]
MLGNSTQLKHWHAWRAKNTACKMAAAIAERDQQMSSAVAVVLDGDNVLGPGFAGHVDSFFGKSPAPARQGFLHWRGTSSGTCGRMGCWLAALSEVGGFREDLLPMGYGDIDLRDRFGVWASSAGLSKREALLCAGDANITGFAIPNSYDGPKAAVREKIALCEGMGMSWGQMNDRNKEKCRKDIVAG